MKATSSSFSTAPIPKGRGTIHRALFRRRTNLLLLRIFKNNRRHRRRRTPRARTLRRKMADRLPRRLGRRRHSGIRSRSKRRRRSRSHCRIPLLLCSGRTSSPASCRSAQPSHFPNPPPPNTPSSTNPAPVPSFPSLPQNLLPCSPLRDNTVWAPTKSAKSPVTTPSASNIRGRQWSSPMFRHSTTSGPIPCSAR